MNSVTFISGRKERKSLFLMGCYFHILSNTAVTTCQIKFYFWKTKVYRLQYDALSITFITYSLSTPYHIYHLFNLTHSHRKKNEKFYADILNKLLGGVTKLENCEFLETYVSWSKHPYITVHALNVAWTDNISNDLNNRCLNFMPGTEW